MTMPHLMNCNHLADGWCLECVGAMYAELQVLRKDADRLDVIGNSLAFDGHCWWLPDWAFDGPNPEDFRFVIDSQASADPF